MAEFTLLKLQLDDASFTANAPFSDSEDETAAPDDEESMSILPILIGLVFLIALGVAVKKFLGGSDEDDIEPSG
jgi:hypothetical protein